MLWFNFILGLKFNFFCFKLIIIYYHSPKQKEIKFKPRIKLNHNIDMEGRWVFDRLWVFPRPNIKAWCMNSSWVTTLSVIRHLGKFSYLYKLRDFSSNQPSLQLLYFSTYSGIKNSLPYPKHMLRAHYISMSLATVIWECSLNNFLLRCS